MTANTIADNRFRHNFSGMDEIWLFAYGSILYKLDFPVLASKPAHIQGWQRRFWQGSHDHRGTPRAPGRVLTLVPAPDQLCAGIALQVEAHVFEHLDHREKNGYLRTDVTLLFDGGPDKPGIVYIADDRNPAWLGPASEHEIAEHIARSHGPSGANTDYALALAAALRKLGVDDPHVFAIEQLLQRQGY